MRLLAGCFAVEVAGYAVMSNHLHVVLRMRPDGEGSPARWTDAEVAARWLTVYPRRFAADGTGLEPTPAEVASAAAGDRVGIWRQRLANLGWFMKALKEPIARRANREDDCRGTFWEGRFHSVPLLDQAALIAAMADVDLNPVRAKMADRPEVSRHTSVRVRAQVRNRHRAAKRIRARVSPAQVAARLAAAGLQNPPTHAEDGIWVTPMARCIVGPVEANDRLSADDYLTLVDATGRMIRPGKRGRIDPALAPILARLDLSVEGWVATMCGWRMFGASSGIGRLAARKAEAARKGVAWIRNRCPVFAA